MARATHAAASVLLIAGILLVFAGLVSAVGFTPIGVLGSVAAIAGLLHAGGVWFGAAVPASTAAALMFDHRLDFTTGAPLLSQFPADIPAEIRMHCLSADAGAEAVAHAAKALPSIVVTDVRMPGTVLAVDLCRHVAANGVPVIVVTAVPPGREYDDMRHAGCAAVLLKPVAPDALVSEINRVLASQGPSPQAN
jgi:CheY-like chemotaxis protein